LCTGRQQWLGHAVQYRPRHPDGKLDLSASRRGANALPAIQFSVVNVSFDELADAEERQYLLNLPTRMSLPPEAIDRLRAAAGQLLRSSEAYRHLVREIGAAR
jgi:hypothetical protein